MGVSGEGNGGNQEVGAPCTPKSHPCPLALAEEELALEPTLIIDEPELERNGCCQDAPAAE